jgi:hypothetical protein
MTKAIYIGDGAYASIGEHGELLVTANHHEPWQATDVVTIDRADAHRLAKFIFDEITGAEQEQPNDQP